MEFVIGVALWAAVIIGYRRSRRRDVPEWARNMDNYRDRRPWR